MGEKVDVLSTMLSDSIHAEAYRMECGVIDSTPYRMRKESDQARAAVAELIEADHEVDAVEDEMRRAYLAGPRRDSYGTGWETKDAATQKDRERRHEAAHKRRAAALANVGGAK